MSAAIQHNSGAWTETLPSGWRWDRLSKTTQVIVSNVDKKTEDGEESVRLCNYVDVYKNDKITAEIAFMEASATPHEIDRFTIRRGDVLATKDSENPLDIAIPSTVAEDLEGVLCGYHLAILRADNRRLLGPYLGWLHVSQTIRAHYEMHATGITRWAVGRQHFKTCPIPIPPLPEQKRIAAYLDASCAAIDRAVATKRQQLETLGALRKSIIQKAATQGLNPEVEMKVVPMDGVGLVPKHWRVRQLRYCCQISYGITLQLEAGKTEGVPILTVQNLDVHGEWKFDHEFCIDEELVHEDDILRHGDLLFNWRNGSAKHVGKTALFNLEGRYTHVSFLLRMRCRKELSPFYLKSYLGALRMAGFFEGAKDKVNKTFNSTELNRLSVLVPPMEEQEKIVEVVQSKWGEIEQVGKVIRSQIETLTAYRKSLIHECVTGQRRITDADVAAVSRTIEPGMKRG
jgi:type I restriction enzyme S subunit